MLVPPLVAALLATADVVGATWSATGSGEIDGAAGDCCVCRADPPIEWGGPEQEVRFRCGLADPGPPSLQQQCADELWHRTPPECRPRPSMLEVGPCAAGVSVEVSGLG